MISNYLKNNWLILCLSVVVFFIGGITTTASAQINYALTAKATQSDGRAAPYDASNYNDNVIAAYGSTPWGWLSCDNSSGTSAWILYEWTKAVSVNELYFYNVLTTTRCMTGAEIQYWTGSAWKTATKFSVPAFAEVSIPFTTVSTTKIRITNFTISGSQVSNPNWREIKAIYHSYGPNDIGVSSIDSPYAYCGGTRNLIVTVSNFGINQVDTMKINWMVDGVLQKAIDYYGLLDTAGGKGKTYAQITLGSLNFSKQRSVKVWTSNPNNVKDTVNSNDTIAGILKPSLSGTFRVGPKSNYKTIKDVVADLNAYGVCGPTTFLISPGTYAGNVTLSTIVGASRVNTITFHSPHVDSVKISNTGSSTTDMNTITLKGASYVTFENMTVEAKGATYGICFMFNGKANHNKVLGCNVIANTSSSSTTVDAIVFSGDVASYSAYGANGSYNLFDNNRITGGYYGLRIVGTGSTAFDVGNSITNNVFTKQYYYGIYAYYEDSLTILNNKISDFTYTYNYAMMLYYSSNFNIQYNYCKSVYYSALAYANYYLWNKKSKSVFANNVLVSTGTSYCLYGYYMANTQFVHNSLSGVGSYLVYWYYANANDIRNNIFQYSGTTYMLYFYNSTWDYWDYNDYYLPSGGTLVYNGTTSFTSLASLKGGYPLYNQHSWDLNPLFIDPSNDLHIDKKFPKMFGAYVGYAKDVDGDPRCVFAPTIGADEFEQSSLPPTANFTTPDTAWLNSQTVFLNSMKPGGAAFYRWYVDGKMVSDSVHLLYKFNQVGMATVSLAMTTCGGSDSISKTVYVSAGLRKPIADFSASARTIYTGDVVSFLDISENGATDWTWKISPVWTYDPFLATGTRTFNYSPKRDSTTASPVVSFDYPGVYEVCLKVSNAKGADSLCRTAYINVRQRYTMCQIPEETTSSLGTLYDDGGPNGNYSAGKTGSSICFGRIKTCLGQLKLTVKEFDLNSGDYFRIYDGYNNSGKPLWNAAVDASGITGKLGDASVPTTFISKSGTVYFEFESDASTATVAPGYVIDWDIVPGTFGAPSANIDMPDTACVGLPVYFNDISTGIYTDVEWDINNDGSIEGYNFTQNYTFNTAGTYLVKLTAISDCAGRDSIIKKIVVEKAKKAPKPALHVSTQQLNVGDTLTISDMSEYCSASTRWDLNPSNFVFVNGYTKTDPIIKVIFTKGGFYDIKLVKSNPFGSDSNTWSSYIKVLDYCNPYVISLDADLGISRVAFNDFDNHSESGVTSYSNYTKSVSTTVEKGLRYSITIERPTNNASVNRKVWIDFNNDGDFNDVGELVSTEKPSNALSYSDSILIPVTANAGTTRMRVASSYKAQSNTPCGPNGLGEFEDYTVVISDKDLTPPTLILKGKLSDTIEVYSGWIEPGYFAADKASGNLTSKVAVSSNLDTTALGIYTVTYTVADDASNMVTLSRTIYVVDRTLPTISLIGDNSIFVEIYNGFNDPGVIFNDNYDKSMVVNTSSNVDTNNLGTYTVDYCVMDASGNGPVCVSRTVVVGDTTLPMISLKGMDKVTVEVFSDYVDSMYIVSDNNLNGLVVTNSGSWTGTPYMLGTFNLVYTATDASGNSASVSREITVVDTHAPLLKLNGNAVDTVDRWSTYTDLLYTLSDNYYDKSELIVETGGNFVNTEKTGIFTITYKASDPSGNVAETVTRLIWIVPTSIDEINGTNGTRIYPNPSSGLVTIEPKNSINSNMNIHVVDAQGRELITYSGIGFSNGTINLDLTSLSPGTYFIKLDGAEYYSVNRLIITRQN